MHLKESRPRTESTRRNTASRLNWAGRGEERVGKGDPQGPWLKWQGYIEMRSWRKGSLELKKFRVGKPKQEAEGSLSKLVPSEPGSQQMLWYASRHYS